MLDEAAVRLFEICVVLMFFGVSVYCIQFSWRTPFNKLRVPEASWFLKLTWWYGAFLQIFLVAMVFLSFVYWFSQRLVE